MDELLLDGLPIIGLPGATATTPVVSIQYGMGVTPVNVDAESHYSPSIDVDKPPSRSSFTNPFSLNSLPPPKGFIGVQDDVLPSDTSPGDFYSGMREISTTNLFVRTNFRFRGKRDSNKFLGFMQKTSGSLIRISNNLELYDTDLTTAEELVYPTDADISQIYQLTTQTIFLEWLRLRRTDASWLV